jgi:hypothetical protein
MVWAVALLGLIAGCDQDTTAPASRTGPELAVGTDPTTGASVSTDKDDYAPGDSAVISGAGWAAGETVHLSLTRDPATSEETGWDVEADEHGTFSTGFRVLDTDAGVIFTLKATGPVSGSVVETVFTDGNIKVTATPAGVSFTLTAVGFTDAACTAGARNLASATATSFSFGVGSSNFVKMTASGASSAGGSFVNWTLPNGTTSTTNPICVPNPQGNDDYVANYSSAATATSLTVAPASGVSGGTTTLSATLKAGSAAVPNKAISFTLNGAAATPVATATTNSSGVATLTNVSLANIAAGSYTTGVGATFAGDAGFAGSTGTAALTVAAGTGLTVAPATGTYGGTTTLQATLTSNGTGVSGKTIGFMLKGTAVCGVGGKPACPATNGSGVATLAGVSLAGIDAGSYSGAVVADFAGDATHAQATGSNDLTVAQATQTITFDLSSLSKTFGDPDFSVAGLAKGGDSGNPVTFKGSTDGTCTVTAAGQVHIVGAGTCTITASQDGNTNYEAAQNVERSFEIARAATSTEVTSSKASSTYGESVTFTATVKPAVSGTSGLGTVQFKDGSGDLGAPAAVGNCSATACTAAIQVGSLTAIGSPHSITAVYSGNVNFLGSTSTAVSQAVSPAPLTGTVDDATRVFGALDPAFTASYTGFVLGETSAIVSGSLSCTTTATATSPVSGSPYQVSCDGPTAPNYTITWKPGKLTIDPAGTTTSVGAVPGVVFGTASVSLSASVAAQSPSTAPVNEGSVTFTLLNGTTPVGSPVSASVASGAASASFPLAGVHAGSYSVSVAYVPGSGTPNFVASSAGTPGTLALTYNTSAGHAFLQPINPNLTSGNRSVFKVGATIPTKFQIFLADGVTPYNGVGATISVRQVDRQPDGQVNEGTDVLAADVGSTFRYDPTAGQYIFNLGTKSWAAGTFQITASLDDGSTISALVDGRTK